MDLKTSAHFLFLKNCVDGLQEHSTATAFRETVSMDCKITIPFFRETVLMDYQPAAGISNGLHSSRRQNEIAVR